jgi:cell wall-associated NlpC family hydrolase
MATVTWGGLPAAGAQERDAAPAASSATPGDADTATAARQVAERRASAHRRQAELTRQRIQAFLAEVAAARVQPVLDTAATGLGRPYRLGAGGPGAFDCSGFTRWAWAAAGVDLPHYSGAQWAQSDHIAVDDLQPGDLVFFWGPGERGDPGHVGLYVGDGQMIHAPGTGRSVRYDSIWYWSGARVAAGRVR